MENQQPITQPSEISPISNEVETPQEHHTALTASPYHHFSRAWSIFYRFVLLIGLFTLVYFVVATPYQVQGDPLPVFANSKFVLTDKLTYLFREPKIGDAIIFINQDPQRPVNNSSSTIGVVIDIQNDNNIRRYLALSTPTQNNPWVITRDKIVTHIYYPHVTEAPTLPTPLPTTDLTFSWQTYTNNKYNFSFKYPPTWINLSSNPQTPEISIEQSFRFQTDNGEYVSGDILKGTVDPSQDSEWKKQFQLGEQHLLIITYTDNLGPSSKGGTQDLEIFNQILSTLQFNGSDQSTNWQTYRNKELGFSIQHPDGWRIAEWNGGVGFGPQQILEDTLVTISYHSKTINPSPEFVDDIGSQFTDRVVSSKYVIVDQHKVGIVTVTTPSHPDWYSQSVIMESPDRYLVISNGGIKDENLPFERGVPQDFSFEKFYSSFKFL